MAKDKKLVEAITSMDEDFAKWYTDIVKKAELIEYTSVKAMRYGKICRKYWTGCSRLPAMKMSACLCLFRKAFCRRKKITLKDLLRRWLG